MNKSQILIYQSPTGNIKIDVRLENETVWLSQKLMAELFQTTVPNINMHLKRIYEEGELEEEATIKDFLIVQMEGRELLTHAGKISHQMALEKSNQELEKYKEEQKQIEREDNLKEMEADIKKLVQTTKSRKEKTKE